MVGKSEYFASPLHVSNVEHDARGSVLLDYLSRVSELFIIFLGGKDTGVDEIRL